MVKPDFQSRQDHFQWSHKRPSRSQSWVNWFTLHRQHSKDTFMDTPQWFIADKSFQRLNPQRKFGDRQTALLAEAAAAQRFDLFWRRVFRPIDDAQILAAPTLDRRL